jgi:hypothetical protein
MRREEMTGREVTAIMAQRIIKVDGKVRTDETYPAGFMGKSFGSGTPSSVLHRGWRERSRLFVWLDASLCILRL